MTRKIKVCPSCGSGMIHKRCRKAADNELYRCSSCKTSFSTPGLKEITVDLSRRSIPRTLRKYLS